MGVTHKAVRDSVTVWFAYTTSAGEAVRAETTSDAEGRFCFDLPVESLDKALIGAEIEGMEPVDLEPGGRPLEPGDLTLVIDDIVPSFLRYGGA